MPARKAGGPNAKLRRTASRSGTTPDAAPPVKVFISYSHYDDAARGRLDVHMAQLKREGVLVFFDGDIIAGSELDPRIRHELRLADIFVALASPAYLHSRYCFEIEYGYALRKARRGRVHLVVALVEECQWRHTRMAHYKLLPKDGKPVSKWRPHGEAFEDIVNGLRGVVKAVRAEQSPAVPAKPARRPKTAPATVRVAPLPKRTRTPPAAAAKEYAPTRPAKPRATARKSAVKARRGRAANHPA